MSPDKVREPVSDGNWKDHLARWIGAQEFNNVLLLTIIAILSYGGYYAIKEAIPQHIKMIQDGLDRASTKHAEDLKAQRESSSAQIERVVTGFEKVVEHNRILMQHILESEQRRPLPIGSHQ